MKMSTIMAAAVVTIGIASGQVNYQAAAQSKWVPAINNAISVSPGAPNGVLYAGEYIWTTVDGTNVITKIRASDGTVVGSFPISAPNWACADGLNIYVVSNGGTLSKLNAATGATIWVAQVGQQPQQCVYHGLSSSVWVTNFGSSTVTRLNATTGAVLGTYPVPSGPQGIMTDGADIYAVSFYGASVSRFTSSGSLVATFPGPPGGQSICFDGSHLWVTSASSNAIWKLEPAGTVIGKFPTGTNPFGCVYAGDAIYTANRGSANVTKLALDGSVLGTYPVGTGPIGIAFDSVWVWTANQTGGSISKM